MFVDNNASLRNIDIDLPGNEDYINLIEGEENCINVNLRSHAEQSFKPGTDNNPHVNGSVAFVIPSNGVLRAIQRGSDGLDRYADIPLSNSLISGGNAVEHQNNLVLSTVYTDIYDFDGNAGNNIYRVSLANVVSGGAAVLYVYYDAQVTGGDPVLEIFGEVKTSGASTGDGSLDIRISGSVLQAKRAARGSSYDIQIAALVTWDGAPA